LTSNIAESFCNWLKQIKGLPVLDCFVEVYDGMMKWLDARRPDGDRLSTVFNALTNWAWSQIQDEINESVHFQMPVSTVNLATNTYQVLDKRSTAKQRTCVALGRWCGRLTSMNADKLARLRTCSCRVAVVYLWSHACPVVMLCVLSMC
jgi:hypothetical protein